MEENQKADRELLRQSVRHPRDGAAAGDSSADAVDDPAARAATADAHTRAVLAVLANGARTQCQEFPQI